MRKESPAATLVAILILVVGIILPSSAPAEVSINIKPGSCPNRVTLKGYGKLPVVVLGAADFNVTEIDPFSMSLTRGGTDGVVTPILHLVKVEDIGTSFTDALCECNEDLTPDGNGDLILKFPRRDLVDALDLDEEIGAIVLLTLSGSLKPEFGRTAFSAQDCLWINKIKAQAKLDPCGKARLKTDEFGNTDVKVKIRNLDPYETYPAYIRIGACDNEVGQSALEDVQADVDGVGISETVGVPYAIDVETWYVSVDVDGSNFCGKVVLKKKRKRR
jgi:hypothetical protein